MAEEQERTTPSGLIVVTKAEEVAYVEKPKKPKREIPPVVKSTSPWIKESKLSPEDRKQRRADNKAMKEIHKKTRKRKRHGRN